MNLNQKKSEAPVFIKDLLAMMSKNPDIVIKPDVTQVVAMDSTNFRFSGYEFRKVAGETFVVSRIPTT